MELWIRSQDKIRLIKTENLIVGGTYKNEIKEESDVFSMSLGTYKTKERALEVLDEIQNKIKYMGQTLEVGTREDERLIPHQFNYVDNIYQMPKE